MSKANVDRYQANHILTASPAEILIRLHDGAIRFCRAAQQGINDQDPAAKGVALDRVLAIIGELSSTLDHGRAPELCGNLKRLYDYLTDRLTEASATMDAAAIDEVVHHLSGMRGAWEAAIAQTPAETMGAVS